MPLNGKEEVKLYLFIGDLTINVKDPKESTIFFTKTNNLTESQNTKSICKNQIVYLSISGNVGMSNPKRKFKVNNSSAPFSSTYTKIGLIQRRSA